MPQHGLLRPDVDVEPKLAAALYDDEPASAPSTPPSGAPGVVTDVSG